MFFAHNQLARYPFVSPSPPHGETMLRLRVGNLFYVATSCLQDNHMYSSNLWANELRGSAKQLIGLPKKVKILPSER